jgi:hypothetical protein
MGKSRGKAGSSRLLAERLLAKVFGLETRDDGEHGRLSREKNLTTTRT